MRKTHNKMIGAGCTALIFLAVSTGPALSKCVKINPLFGTKVFVNDKYCKKKNSPKRAMRRAVHRTTMAQKAPRRMAARGPVRQMQALLTNMGYNPGPADGVSGPDTQKAANEFRSSIGMSEKTSVPDTLKALKRISGK